MSNAIRRRNGSQASCEPCRKCKVRCDHEKPTCGSCRRRGLGAKCWYHPAPLTKQRHAVQAPSFPLIEPQAAGGPKQPSNDGSSPGSAVQARGPRFHTWPYMTEDAAGAAPQCAVGYTSTGKSTQEYLPIIKRILSHLKYFEDIKTFLDYFFTSNQVSLVPGPLIRQIVASIQNCPIFSSCIRGLLEGDPDELSRVAQAVLCNASSDIIIDASLDLEGFCALFCGPNIRVEPMGLLYTIAAHALFMSDKKASMEDALVQNMVQGSNMALRLARDLATQPNDLLIWLAYENFHLMVLVEGDASLHVWRNLGDLATDLFALGLHREENYSASKIPFFLAECRRKAFATANHVDKAIAAVFNRPPRISTRYADCKLPLEISDDVLFAKRPGGLKDHEACLTPEGWNTDGKIRTTTWARMRYILSRYREELVEYTFRPRRPSDDSELRGLLKRFQHAWESIPSHLTSTQTCWSSDLPTEISLMLGKMHLLHLHIQFQIWRLIDGSAATYSPELLTVAATLLETVIRLSNAREMAGFYFRDLAGMILMYGLPGAAVLTNTLQNTCQTSGPKFPPAVNRALVIRNLSVLVSRLETATSPDNANHAFCMQASRAMAGVLDSILDTTSQSTPEAHQDASRAGDTIAPSMSIDAQAAGLPSAQTTNAEYNDLGDFTAFDFDTWALNVDFGAVSNQWIKF